MNYNCEPFFAFARERHNIYLRRSQGLPRPWTDDVILQTCRFTNVYRELDKTTVWFREKIREPLRSRPEVLLATVLFRWFNRIATGEGLFLQQDLNRNSPFEFFLQIFNHEGIIDVDILKKAILDFCGEGPYVTGAFIINTPTGMTKLDGVLWAFGEFCKQAHPLKWGKFLLDPNIHGKMEIVHGALKRFPRLGDFMAYEIVCDLRYTDLLMGASDKLTWANPGPGAKRGLSYLLGGSRKLVPPAIRHREQQIEAMRQILGVAPIYGFHDWEMREVEHTLCEYAKYEMVKRKEGKTKGMFK